MQDINILLVNAIKCCGFVTFFLGAGAGTRNRHIAICLEMISLEAYLNFGPGYKNDKSTTASNTITMDAEAAILFISRNSKW